VSQQLAYTLHLGARNTVDSLFKGFGGFAAAGKQQWQYHNHAQ
jgi:hypothetical protein